MKRWTLPLMAALTAAVLATTPSPMAYRNAQYGFQLSLPSKAWKQVPYTQGLIAFGTKNPKRQVSVQIRVESAARYANIVKSFHHLVSNLPNLLQKARITEGKTPQGNPISTIEVIEWGDKDVPMVVSISHTRLLSRNTTVITTFQGQLTIHDGKHLDRAEINLEEAEAKAVCQSVDTLP